MTVRKRAVVIGGGTGAPVSIRALLSLGLETSAVVAMADDGGSTGILREEADATTPGDVRKCIAAMARDPESPLVRAFASRLEVARNHALGNLMLAALEDVTGSFPDAVAICERLVEARGHVYPSTLSNVSLVARTRDGVLLRGQANACRSRTALEQVELETSDPDGIIEPYSPALAAIREADLIVLGPGSLFTSVIPNLLVPGVVEAIQASRGCVLFVCSLADMQGETWGLTAREHVEALLDHGMRGLVDYVLVHADDAEPSVEPSEGSPAESSAESLAAGAARLSTAQTSTAAIAKSPACSEHIRLVSAKRDDIVAIRAQGPMVIVRNLVDPQHPTWHHPQALSDAFEEVLRLCRSRQK